MLGYVDSYYKSQMNRFLKLKDDLVNEDIKVLERVLYTLNTAKTYKIQNIYTDKWTQEKNHFTGKEGSNKMNMELDATNHKQKK